MPVNSGITARRVLSEKAGGGAGVYVPSFIPDCQEPITCGECNGTGKAAVVTAYAADSIPGMPRPFSVPNFSKNQEKRGVGRGENCAICGKWISDDKCRIHVPVGDGGNVFLSPDESKSQRQQNDHMGVFPIGPECWRKHKAAFVALGYGAGKAEG